MARPAPRSNVWLGFGLANTNIPIATTATLLATLNAAALALRPFTVVRTRLVMSVVSDQAAASEFLSGALSFQVVTETAAAAGIASLPTPLVETDADFFVYQPFHSSLVRTASGLAESVGEGSSWTIDSKSMRKVQTDDDFAIIVEGRTGNGFNIALEGRMLVKLH